MITRCALSSSPTRTSGAWTGEPLLQHEWARHRIGDALEDVDELVLPGDLFDFLFSSLEDAFAQADGFVFLPRKPQSPHCRAPQLFFEHSALLVLRAPTVDN